MKRILFPLVFLLGLNFCLAQGNILIIPDSDCQITIDGEITEQLSKGSPKKFNLTFGEHYIQAINNDKEITKILKVETKQQKIVKLNFDVIENSEENKKEKTPTSNESSSILIAELDLTLYGGVNELADTPTASESELYYAFEKGDEILISADIKNKKGKFYINVYSYPDLNSIYSKSKLRDLNQAVKIREKGIYIIEIGTEALFDKKIKLKVERKPASQATANFNTTVIKKYKFETIEVEKSFHFINSTSHETFRNGTNEVVIPINIPKESLEWYYSFSASRNKAEVEANMKKGDLLNKLTTALNGIDPTTTAINIGMNLLIAPPGADYCDVYLLDHYNMSLFKNDNDQMRYILEGSRENLKSSTIKVKCCMDGQQYYLGIQNRDTMNGVHVGVEVIAVKRVEFLEQEESL